MNALWLLVNLLTVLVGWLDTAPVPPPRADPPAAVEGLDAP